MTRPAVRSPILGGIVVTIAALAIGCTGPGAGDPGHSAGPLSAVAGTADEGASAAPGTPSGDPESPTTPPAMTASVATPTSEAGGAAAGTDAPGSASTPTDTSASTAAATDSTTSGDTDSTASGDTAAGSDAAGSDAAGSTTQAARPRRTGTASAGAPRTSSAAAPTTSRRPPADRILTQQMLGFVNQHRRAAGVPAVSARSCANSSALTHARNQAAAHRMYHRSLAAITEACHMAGGENVAYGYPSVDAVLRAWWQSSGHRANILDQRYRYMGAAVAYASDGTPYYAQVFYLP